EESLRQLQQSRSCSSCSPDVQQEHPPIRRPLSPVAATVSYSRPTAGSSELEPVYIQSDTVSYRFHSSDTVSSPCQHSQYSRSHLMCLVERIRRDQIAGRTLVSDMQLQRLLQHYKLDKLSIMRAHSQSAAPAECRSESVLHSPRIQLPTIDDPKRDFSPEAIKGAVVIYDVPYSTTTSQLIAFLAQIGPLSEVSWPIYTMASHEYYAVAKYEHDDAARRASVQLTASKLDT
ncbi:hypothetical protein PFISCL1PPCAC_21345, partial [Pristionchus fissidentatus]